ncbi:unnamed protein product [Clonostachys rosea]|uniref:Uncharacterized protein n=1 Tax=Bionectria ochroleuca TaxID=29856 RepID=A0ABY6U065_BIOOC|nr:unnamed protein product [Clonostachys rosea]
MRHPLYKKTGLIHKENSAAHEEIKQIIEMSLAIGEQTRDLAERAIALEELSRGISRAINGGTEADHQEVQEAMESKKCEHRLQDLYSLEAESSFRLFDRYTQRLRNVFGDRPQYRQFREENVPVLCRGREIASPILGSHLHQGSSYHSAGDTKLRHSDERPVNSQDADNATSSKRDQFLWRWWPASRRKKPLDPPKPVLPSENQARETRPPAAAKPGLRYIKIGGEERSPYNPSTKAGRRVKVREVYSGP